MNLQKVQLITVNQYPTEKPYIRENDFYLDFNTNQIFRSECEHNNKKILMGYQPIKFLLILPGQQAKAIMSHEEIIQCKFKCEMLDDLMDDIGLFSTKFQEFSFDVSLCELILLAEKGVCWLDYSKKVIHLQENQTHVSRKSLAKK
jgi:hypothetical protein